MLFSYNTQDIDAIFAAAFASIGTAQYVISIIIGIISIVAMWKIYSKAGEPGWAAIVPFYNLYVLFKITWGQGSRFWMLLIPIYNIILMIQTQIKLARVFGKSGGFAAGLIFLGPIFHLILAFSSAEYTGPDPA